MFPTTQRPHHHLLFSMPRRRPIPAATVLAFAFLVVAAGTGLIGRTGRAAAHQPAPTGRTLQLDAPSPGDSTTPAGARATTRERVEGECPVMTDSIRRLYLGFLEREPTATELRGDIARYRGETIGLEGLAGELADSGRFRDRYQPLSDRGYVERVYINTLRRFPTEDETRYWAATLGQGYPRGNVMLAFTESADFVEATGTARPLSGYLNWYPQGVQWYCEVGPAQLAVRDLTGPFVYADYRFTNHGDDDAAIELRTTTGGVPRLSMVETTLPAGYTDFRWDGQFSGSEHYGDGIDVRVDDETSWVVVFYPTSIGRHRLGWQHLG